MQDRVLAPDIERVRDLVASGALTAVLSDTMRARRRPS
jgi:hypothetical protein